MSGRYYGFVFMLIVLALTVIAVIAYKEPGGETSETATASFTRVNYKDAPRSVQTWLDDARDLFLAQKKTIGDRVYVLVTYGERPTGGYSVTIQEVNRRDDRIQVIITFSRPRPGEPVSMAFTYPYDLVYIEGIDMPLEYVARGDEEYIPSLMGIDEMPEIVAGSKLIKVFSPRPSEYIESEFVVQGVANVFEGTILYRLEAGEEKLSEGITTAGMLDWYYFSVNISVPPYITAGSSLLFNLFTESAKDGSVRDLVQIPLVLQ